MHIYFLVCRTVVQQDTSNNATEELCVKELSFRSNMHASLHYAF